MKVIIALLAAVALAIPARHSSSCSSDSASDSCSGSYSCDTCQEHHHHHHQPHHGHGHHHGGEHIRIGSCSHEDIVLMDHSKPVVVAPVNNAVAPKEVKPAQDAVVVVVPNTNPVYTVDPAQLAPYKNGLTIDIFSTCSGNKAFIAKRNNGIYTESYNIKAAGQTKPKIYM